MTEMNNNDLDRLFREKFEGQETAPPDSAWPNIERELGKTSGRGGTGRWWISGITAVVIGLAGWWYFGSSHLSSGQIAENRTNENKTQQTNSSSQNNNANETKNTSSENTNTPGSTADLKPVLADEKSGSSSSSSETKNPQTKAGASVASKSPQTTASVNPQDSREPAKRNNGNRQAASPSPKDVTAAGLGKKGKFDDQRDPGPHVPAIVYDQKNPVDPIGAPPEKDTQLAEAGSSGQEKTTATDPQQKATASEKAIADSTLLAEMLAPADKTNSDSSKTGAEDAGTQAGQNDQLPAFFAGLHVSVESQKISSSENYGEDFTRADVSLTGEENSSPEIISQSYSYGGRLGWFASKHFALVGGLYFNSFEMNSTGGSLKYNHNDEVLFTMHSAASSVQMNSGSFSHEDSYYGPSDTFLVKLSSKENYSFLNFQLGASYYPWRNQRFGAYVNLLSNGAYLTKENMTLTSAKTGNSFRFSEKEMSGMNKFTLGAQLGTGFEFTPVPHLGIWIEPAYFFSASLNKKNAFALKPSAFRFQCGLAAHF